MGGSAVNDLPPSERGRLLSELAATLATLPTHQPQTWRLGEAMRRIVRAEGIAITVEYLSDGRTTLCASDDVADAVESLQEVAGEGPGFDAARSDAIVVADLDGDADQRWPMLSAALEQRIGPLRVYAVPLRDGGVLAGVATLYTAHQQPLAEAPDHVAFLANAVGAALLVEAAQQSEEADDVGNAWSSRSVVHQATGMVMAQVRVRSEDALALLLGHAYALGTDVTDVATRVVERKINFSNFDVEGD
jgi:hypothetical protein